MPDSNVMSSTRRSLILWRLSAADTDFRGVATGKQPVPTAFTIFLWARENRILPWGRQERLLRKGGRAELLGVRGTDRATVFNLR